MMMKAVGRCVAVVVNSKFLLLSLFLLLLFLFFSFLLTLCLSPWWTWMAARLLASTSTLIVS